MFVDYDVFPTPCLAHSFEFSFLEDHGVLEFNLHDFAGGIGIASGDNTTIHIPQETLELKKKLTNKIPNPKP